MPPRTAVKAELLDRARSLAPLIRAHADESERLRRLATPVVDAFHDAGLFRMTLPRYLGGGEAPITVLAQVAEMIASADASTAWCLGQALGCAMSAAYLDEGPAREVFGTREAVLAWGAGNAGRATACDGGYLIDGRWGFASGGRHATFQIFSAWL